MAHRPDRRGPAAGNEEGYETADEIKFDERRARDSRQESTTQQRLTSGTPIAPLQEEESAQSPQPPSSSHLDGWQAFIATRPPRNDGVPQDDSGEGPSQRASLMSPRASSGDTIASEADGTSGSREEGERSATARTSSSSMNTQHDGESDTSSSLERMPLQTRFNDRPAPHQLEGVGCSPLYRNPPGQLEQHKTISPRPSSECAPRRGSEQVGLNSVPEPSEKVEMDLVSEPIVPWSERLWTTFLVPPIAMGFVAAVWSLVASVHAPVLCVRAMEDLIRMLAQHCLSAPLLLRFVVAMRRWQLATAHLPYGERRPIPVLSLLLYRLSFLLSYWSGRNPEVQSLLESTQMRRAEDDDNDVAATSTIDNNENAQANVHGQENAAPRQSTGSTGTKNAGTWPDLRVDTRVAALTASAAVEGVEGTLPLIPGEHWSDEDSEQNGQWEDVEDHEALPQVTHGLPPPPPPPPPWPPGRGISYSLNFVNMSVDALPPAIRSESPFRPQPHRRSSTTAESSQRDDTPAPLSTPDRPRRLNTSSSMEEFSRSNHKLTTASTSPRTPNREERQRNVSDKSAEEIKKTFESPWKTENLSPKHHRCTSNMASVLSNTSVRSPLDGLSKLSASKISGAPAPDVPGRERAESVESVESNGGFCSLCRNCYPSLAGSTQGLVAEIQPLNGLSPKSVVNQVVQSSPSQIRGTWSARKLLSSLSSSLDELGRTLNPAPSPVFGNRDPTFNNATSPAARNTSSACLAPGNIFQEDQSPSFHGTLEQTGRLTFTDRIPSLNLDGFREEDECPPPIKSPKKQKKKVVQTPTRERDEAENSFGIDHSYSPTTSPSSRAVSKSQAVSTEHMYSATDSDSREDLDSKHSSECYLTTTEGTVAQDESDGSSKVDEQSQESSRTSSNCLGSPLSWSQNGSPVEHTVFAASISSGPDPLHYMGRNLGFITHLLTPKLPVCEHRVKLSAYTDSPLDFVHSITEPAKVDACSQSSFTDLSEEAYLTTIKLHICEPGPKRYVSRLMADAIMYKINVSGEDKEKVVTESSRDWGLNYLAEKTAQRLKRRRQKAAGEIAQYEAECESDDDTPRSSFSSRGTPSGSLPQKKVDETEGGRRELDGCARSLGAMAQQEDERKARVQAAMAPQEPSSQGEVRFDEISQRAFKDEDRRDSRAEDMVSPTSSSPVNKQTPPPSYEHATALASSATAEDLSIRVRERGDNASISTSSSSERARMAFRLRENSGSWRPFQSKSTASVGFSAGQAATGNVSLRDAVSPTQGDPPARSSALEFLSERARARAEYSGDDEGKEMNDSPDESLPQNGILKTTHIEVKVESEEQDSPPWKESRPKLNEELDLKPLTTRDDESLSSNNPYRQGSKENAPPKTTFDSVC